MNITKKCQQCRRIAEVTNTFDFPTKRGHLLRCGHILTEEKPKEHTLEEIFKLESTDGKKLYKFQAETVQFLERANGNALVAHEMGLGKTPIAAVYLNLHEEHLPCLVICKSSLVVQMQREFIRWADIFLQRIETSKDVFLPGMQGYIISFDLLRRFNGKLIEIIQKLSIKTILIDEVQQIKNPTSKRTVEVKTICKEVGKTIGLSGTPIKNNAAEYFPILNVLHPEMFPKFESFLRFDCESYWNGYGWKVGALANPERFKEKTKDFIIRYERSEVLPDLPKVSRQFRFCDLGATVEQAYKKEVKEFIAFHNSDGKGMSSFERASSTIAYLSRMRHLTGLSKIDPCVDFCAEFLESSDRKLTIFVHHKDVAEILRLKLTSLCEELQLEAPLNLNAELNSEQRQNVVEKFKSNGARILLASTLAAGEGLNLQFCSDCVMLERQWNPANEEQAECRFVRIGQLADSVAATYYVAVGTVDEFFAELVEKKREIVSGTLGGQSVPWDESSIMKELAEMLAQKGGKKWGF